MLRHHRDEGPRDDSDLDAGTRADTVTNFGLLGKSLNALRRDGEGAWRSHTCEKTNTFAANTTCKSSAKSNRLHVAAALGKGSAVAVASAEPNSPWCS